MKRCLAWLILVAATQVVAAFTVEPMSAELAPSGSGAVASFRISNDAAEPVALQISVQSRSMDASGQELNIAAPQDFTVLPARLVLEPHSVRVVRVQWRGTASLTSELAYRLIVEQVPVSFSTQSASGIRVMFRYRASLYVVPPGARPLLVAEAAQPIEREGQLGIALTIRNDGNKHGIIKNVNLSLRRDGQSWNLPSELLDKLLGTNMLAKSRLELFVRWPEAKAGGAYEAVFTAELD
jgi:fimbrial chaperone protein